jgi:hypothetical protein
MDLIGGEGSVWNFWNVPEVLVAFLKLLDGFLEFLDHFVTFPGRFLALLDSFKASWAYFLHLLIVFSDI